VIPALFEDEDYRNFLPLTHTRPVFELRSGMLNFLERLQKTYAESKILLFAREYLAPTLRKRVSFPVNKPERIDDHVLLVNGSLIVNEEVRALAQKKLASKNVLMLQNHRLAMASLSEEVAKKYGKELCKPLTKTLLRKLSRECKTLNAKNLPLIDYPWGLVNQNRDLLQKDFARVGKLISESTIDQRTAVYGDKRSVHIGKDSVVEAFAVLDAREGPIFIGEETVIQAGSRITGPAYIGNKTIVASGLIRGGCSIGHMCRVGGEMEETIILGYSNKYHTGFIGHSYIGEWVNLGAATTNSDLKNTYGNVKVTIDQKRVDTNTAKVGCFIGDHAKTSIGTQIFTGTKIGVAAHTHGFVTEDVPSFTIWAKSLGAKNVELSIQSAIQTQKRVFARRGVKQTREDIKLLETLFKITAKERKEAGVCKEKFKFS